jgi:hypothetical protein
MIRIAFAALALALSAPLAAAESCSAHAGAPLVEGWTVEAQVFGPTCETAIVTLVVRSPDNWPAYFLSDRAVAMILLSEITDAKGMNSALGTLVRFRQEGLETFADLPAWKKGAEAPTMNGEFPFAIANGWDQFAWAMNRKDNKPLFCFVGRSTRVMWSDWKSVVECFVLDPDQGEVTEVGIQGHRLGKTD